MVHDFNMSQELFDHMQDEREEEIIDLVNDGDGWYENIAAVVQNDGNLIDTADDTIDMIEEDKSFKSVYAKSIAPSITIAGNIFKRYGWR